MTPANRAVQNSISFECKKDALQQRQSGDWKISFTVQGTDMDDRITRAPMGTRYMAVLVEIGDNEEPVFISPKATKAKREWRDVPATEQAGIRCSEARFNVFLWEECGVETNGPSEAAEAVRDICKVSSRKDFKVNAAAEQRWRALDDQYQAWITAGE